MENVVSKKILNRALEEYDAAREELNKPLKDLVLIAEFDLIQKAIKDFLIAFLFEKGLLASEKDDLEDIQAQCARINKDFENVDLKQLNILCREDSHIATSNMDGRQMAEYAKIMEQIRNLVLASMDEKLLN